MSDTYEYKCSCTHVIFLFRRSVSPSWFSIIIKQDWKQKKDFHQHKTRLEAEEGFSSTKSRRIYYDISDHKLECIQDSMMSISKTMFANNVEWLSCISLPEEAWRKQTQNTEIPTLFFCFFFPKQINLVAVKLGYLLVSFLYVLYT